MKWKTDPAGQLTFHPLVQFHSAILHGTILGFQFDLAGPKDAPGDASEYVQVKMTVTQATALVQELQQMIASIRDQKRPEKPN